MATAGRKPGFRHNEETRAKIKSGVIIQRLQKHIEAKEDLMSPSQVNAAKVLLAKVLPDLKAMDLTGQVSFAVTLESDAKKL